MREGPAKVGEGPAAEARPPGRGYPELGWGSGALGTSNLAKVVLTRPTRRGSGRIEYACGGITGRSPSFGDHLSGRQTRKHVRRSRSRVPAALFLDVLGSPWGLLGSFFECLGGIWGGLGGLLGSSWVVLGWSWGVWGRSWGGPGRVLGGLVAILRRQLEQLISRLFF